MSRGKALVRSRISLPLQAHSQGYRTEYFICPSPEGRLSVWGIPVLFHWPRLSGEITLLASINVVVCQLAVARVVLFISVMLKQYTSLLYERAQITKFTTDEGQEIPKQITDHYSEEN